MAALSLKFWQHAEPLMTGVPDDTMVNQLCEDLVLKMLHTMSNDFLRNIGTLENLKDKRAVDIQMTLRDELKSFALHVQSTFSTNN